MKEIEIKIIQYACEFCSLKSPHRHIVEKCERRHKQPACEHKETRIVADLQVDAYNNTCVFVNKICTICDEALGTKEFDEEELKFLALQKAEEEGF